jgi:hypothetical protein
MKFPSLSPPFLLSTSIYRVKGGDNMIEQNVTDSQLRLSFDFGKDVDGNQVVKYKSFNNVKTDATADALHSIATALAPLQQHPLLTVERNNSYEIIETVA